MTTMGGYYDDDSDLSSNSGLSSSSSSSSSSTTNGRDSDDSVKRSGEEGASEFVGSGYDIITKSNLQLFLQRVDSKAFLDDQTTNLMARIADAFVNDVCNQVVKLAHLREGKPNIPDLEIILKREYNMQFPKRRKNSKKFKKNN